MGHWFWAKNKEKEWRPIYAKSEAHAKEIRTQLAKKPDIVGFTPIRPISSDRLPNELKVIIKRAKDGK